MRGQHEEAFSAGRFVCIFLTPNIFFTCARSREQQSLFPHSLFFPGVYTRFPPSIPHSFCLTPPAYAKDNTMQQDEMIGLGGTYTRRIAALEMGGEIGFYASPSSTVPIAAVSTLEGSAGLRVSGALHAEGRVIESSADVAYTPELSFAKKCTFVRPSYATMGAPLAVKYTSCKVWDVKYDAQGNVYCKTHKPNPDSSMIKLDGSASAAAAPTQEMSLVKYSAATGDVEWIIDVSIDNFTFDVYSAPNGSVRIALLTKHMWDQNPLQVKNADGSASAFQVPSTPLEMGTGTVAAIMYDGAGMATGCSYFTAGTPDTGGVGTVTFAPDGRLAVMLANVNGSVSVSNFDQSASAFVWQTPTSGRLASVLVVYGAAGMVAWGVPFAHTVSNPRPVTFDPTDGSLYTFASYGAASAWTLLNGDGTQSTVSIAADDGNSHVVKYSSSGQALWAYGLPMYSWYKFSKVLVDSLGDMYMFGSYDYISDNGQDWFSPSPERPGINFRNLDGTPSDVTMPPVLDGDNYNFLVKMTKAGTVVWGRMVADYPPCMFSNAVYAFTLDSGVWHLQQYGLDGALEGDLAIQTPYSNNSVLHAAPSGRLVVLHNYEWQPEDGQSSIEIDSLLPNGQRVPGSAAVTAVTADLSKAQQLLVEFAPPVRRVLGDFRLPHTPADEVPGMKKTIVNVGDAACSVQVTGANIEYRTLRIPPRSSITLVYSDELRRWAKTETTEAPPPLSLSNMRLTGTTTLAGDVVPEGVVNLGTMESQFNDAYFSGSVYVTQTSTPSDIRIKEGVAPVTGALEKISGLTGITYRLTRDGAAGRRRAGLIAQEIQAVLPEAVTELQGGPHGSHLSVDYSSVSCLYVEAIKELVGRVRSLEQEVRALRQPGAAA